LAIRIREGAKLPRAKQRRFTREEALEVKKQLGELLEAGKVRESRSDSAVGTLFVPKSDGTKRWCMDMRPINAITITDENKAPLQDTTRERIQGARFFTRLDMRDGYHHLRIRKGDEHLTAFITEYGLYEWTVACFGLKNAPAEFARYMSNILREFLNDFVVVYFDDIIIFSKDEEAHWQHVRKVLKKLQEAKVNLKIKKCEFKVTETEFLGHIINGETSRMQYEKVKAILEWPTPVNCEGIAGFRGLAGYYRQYVKRFSDRMKALNEILRKGEFVWEKEEERAFQDVKNAYRDEQVLILYDPEKQTWLHADASDYAIGAEISQKDSNGKRRPVLFYSRKLLPAEMNYATPDKELLAIVQTMKKFQHYLRGTKYPVIVKSDHRNLRTFMTTKELNARQARWAEELSSYDFVIEHIKGKENVVADALSRRPDYKEENIIDRTNKIFEETERGLVINKNVQLKMVTMTNDNEELDNKIREETRRDERYPEKEIEADGFKRFNGLVIVPKKLETDIMQRYHTDIREGHPGEARTIEKIQRNYYFPGAVRKVRKFIQTCDECQRNKPTRQKAQGKMHKGLTPTRPWQHITVDFVDVPSVKNVYSQDRMDQVMVVVDRFTKQTILIPAKKSYTTKEVFHIFWERVFSIFGIPETITSDRDKIFRSKEWLQLMKDIGVTQILSTANHQQTDGQSERKIQEIQAYLRNYLDYEQTNWMELLPVTQYALNDAESATTKVTPNFAVFGTIREKGWEKPVDEETPLAERMRIYHHSIKMEQEWMKEQYKRYYDQKRVEAPSLEEGGRVYLRRRTLGQKKFNVKTLRESTKLDQLQLGPFTIKKKLDFDNYELLLPPRMKIHPVFHISLLQPTENPETIEDIEANDAEYEVEKILDKRTRKGVTEYKIRWKGYSNEDDTWEPTSHLNCPEKIREFQRRGIAESSGRRSGGEGDC
jgi:transposase InsO family protein